MSEIGYDTSDPTTLYCDNQSALALTMTKAAHQRTKHIGIKYSYVRERYDDQEILPTYLETSSMLADLLTKPLDSRRHALLMELIGVVQVVLN
jgi:hypothetical protein